jgi:hypothetical protein
MARAAVRVAVALLAVVASVTVWGAASSRAAQTISAPPAGKKYISKRYGYSIAPKGSYLFTPAKQQWDGRFPFGATGQVDLIAGWYVEDKFAVAAKPVPAGMTLSEWEACVEGVQQQFCYGLRDPALVSWRRTGTRVRQYLSQLAVELASDHARSSPQRARLPPQLPVGTELQRSR